MNTPAEDPQNPPGGNRPDLSRPNGQRSLQDVALSAVRHPGVWVPAAVGIAVLWGAAVPLPWWVGLGAIVAAGGVFVTLVQDPGFDRRSGGRSAAPTIDDSAPTEAPPAGPTSPEVTPDPPELEGSSASGMEVIGQRAKDLSAEIRDGISNLEGDEKTQRGETVTDLATAIANKVESAVQALAAFDDRLAMTLLSASKEAVAKASNDRASLLAEISGAVDALANTKQSLKPMLSAGLGIPEVTDRIASISHDKTTSLGHLTAVLNEERHVAERWKACPEGSLTPEEFQIGIRGVDSALARAPRP